VDTARRFASMRRSWASTAHAATYTMGSVNLLTDRVRHSYLTGDDHGTLIGVPKRTLAGKAKLVRERRGSS
jgi:hypothetical protein